MKIATLADVRVLIEQHLPEHFRTGAHDFGHQWTLIL
jgi:hypothetical protein